MKRVLTKIDFGNEAGDDVETSELESFFVEQDQFKPFSELKQKIFLITAKKGGGKSALLKWLQYKIPKSDKEAIVLWLRGSDLTRNKFKLVHELKTPNEYIQDWMIRLAAVANRKLATLIGLALTDNDISMIESAELEGFKQRNFISTLFDRMTKLFPETTNKKIGISNEIETLKRAKKPKIAFLIDDLDATFQNSKDELMELSTFFSACRYLSQDMDGVYFRVTLRSDVWPIIRRFDESLDKVEQYAKQIFWSRPDFINLVERRIEHQLALLGEIDKEIEKLYIEDKVNDYKSLILTSKMSWGEKNVPSLHILYILSYERPRWGIQLLKLAQDAAIRMDDELIYKKHIDRVWGDYGKKRISDLVSEHKHQCTTVEEIVNSFRGAERRLQRDDLFIWINNRILNHTTPIIEGKRASSPIDIAHFLFRIGFIVARSDSDKGYQHYSFDEMNDLLSGRTSTDYNLDWEIHPCYRQALDIKKLDEYQRMKHWK